MLKHIVDYLKCYIPDNNNLKSIVLNLYTRSIRDEYSRLWYWHQFSPDIVWQGPISVNNSDLGQSFIDPNKLFNFGRLKFTTTINV